MSILLAKLGMLLRKILDKENGISKKMLALIHQSYRGSEVCEGIASDEMSEGDFDQ